MKKLFGKMSLIVAAAVALFGISASNLRASISNIDDKTPLYLEHGKQITAGIDFAHGSHVSHGSHESHHSHYSSR